MLAAGRPQRAVEDAQQYPQYAAGEKAPQIQRGGIHPKSR